MRDTSDEAVVGSEAGSETAGVQSEGSRVTCVWRRHDTRTIGYPLLGGQTRTRAGYVGATADVKVGNVAQA